MKFSRGPHVWDREAGGSNPSAPILSMQELQPAGLAAREAGSQSALNQRKHLALNISSGYIPRAFATIPRAIRHPGRADRGAPTTHHNDLTRLARLK